MTPDQLLGGLVVLAVVGGLLMLSFARWRQ